MNFLQRSCCNLRWTHETDVFYLMLFFTFASTSQVGGVKCRMLVVPLAFQTSAKTHSLPACFLHLIRAQSHSLPHNFCT